MTDYYEDEEDEEDEEEFMDEFSHIDIKEWIDKNLELKWK